MMRLSYGMKGVAIAALLAAGLAAPADARGRHRHHHHDDVDAGDVITGVALAGGIAAIASAISRDHRARKDDAVESCAGEAEFRANGRVSEILSVRKSRGYYTVEGIVDGDAGGDSFLCTIRKGRIYSFETSAGER